MTSCWHGRRSSRRGMRPPVRIASGPVHATAPRRSAVRAGRRRCKSGRPDRKCRRSRKITQRRWVSRFMSICSCLAAIDRGYGFSTRSELSVDRPTKPPTTQTVGGPSGPAARCGRMRPPLLVCCGARLRGWRPSARRAPEALSGGFGQAMSLGRSWASIWRLLAESICR